MRATALAQGFELTGVAAAPAADAVDGQETAQRFTDWIDDGRAGEMDYLKRRDAAGEFAAAVGSRSVTVGPVGHCLRVQLQRGWPCIY